MERDSTQEWRLPAVATPPLFSELEARVDLALATARASEQAVYAVGEAAIDAAKQARRAAELAERASVAALAAAGGGPVEHPPRQAPVAVSRPQDAGLRGFNDRADRVMARLRALERGIVRGHPAGVATGSGDAAIDLGTRSTLRSRGTSGPQSGDAA